MRRAAEAGTVGHVPQPAFCAACRSSKLFPNKELDICRSFHCSAAHQPFTVMNTRVPCRAPRFPEIISVAILIGGGLVAEQAAAQQIAPPVQCGFEEPDFMAGSIHGQRDWSVEQGRAEIIDGQAHGGSRALKLFPADPFSQAKLALAPGVPPSPVMFLDFYVIPATSDAARQEEFLDVDGARIGLFSDPAKPGEGVVHVFHGNGAGGGNWLATAVTVPLKEGGNQTSTPPRE